MIGLWCNGSTTGFGSVCPSSNLGSPTTNQRKALEETSFRAFSFVTLKSPFLYILIKIEVYRGAAYIEFIHLILFVILTISIHIVLVVE